jgi:7-cyano-7-deazaguanine synthase
MDSIALAWWQRPEHAITIDYGQLAASAEVAASIAVCEELGIRHTIVTVDASSLGSGDMAGLSPDPLAPASDWWPFRNQFLVTVAAMRLIGQGIRELLLGTVATDATHRDGTADFVCALDAVLATQEGEVRVRAPALHMSTLELIRVSSVPRSVLAWAHSCHKATVPCGQCRGCNKVIDVLYQMNCDERARAAT